MTEAEPDARLAQRDDLEALLGGRPLVLVGMMGAGKTTVGRKLATRLGRRFIDSDDEIEKAAGMKIPEIFASRGEAEFRAGEQRVIARLLKEADLVLASGGGAFVNAETRALIRANAVSVFLTAEFEILFNRVSRRGNRPLLKTPNPRETLQQLIAERAPIYAEADVTVQSKDVPQDVVAGEVVAAVLAHLRLEADHL